MFASHVLPLNRNSFDEMLRALKPISQLYELYEIFYIRRAIIYFYMFYREYEF